MCLAKMDDEVVGQLIAAGGAEEEVGPVVVGNAGCVPVTL